MHAIYHCVPARTLKSTDDLNVSLVLLLRICRSEHAHGARKIKIKREKESSYSALRVRIKEMNGYLALNT